jgi:dihydroneopterin aldolase
MTEPAKIHPLKIADAQRAIRHLFVHDLVLDAQIGVHAHEKTGVQSVRINVDLSIAESDVPHDDALVRVVCYERLVNDIKEIVSAEHINLVETLAERIAEVCFGDHRVLGARVRVEKLSIIAEAASVGVEIERLKPAPRARGETLRD